eukprot:5640664-Prymnesium_polylepis.1
MHARKTLQTLGLTTAHGQVAMLAGRTTRRREYPSFEAVAIETSRREHLKRARDDEDEARNLAAAIQASLTDGSVKDYENYCFLCLDKPNEANQAGIATVSHVNNEFNLTCPHKVCTPCASGYLFSERKAHEEKGFDVRPTMYAVVSPSAEPLVAINSYPPTLLSPLLLAVVRCAACRSSISSMSRFTSRFLISSARGEPLVSERRSSRRQSRFAVRLRTEHPRQGGRPRLRCGEPSSRAVWRATACTSDTERRCQDAVS